MFKVIVYTNSRDKRRDRATNTVTKLFKTLDAAQTWATSELPKSSNIYQFHEGIGYWSINYPMPKKAAA